MPLDGHADDKKDPCKHRTNLLPFPATKDEDGYRAVHDQFISELKEDIAAGALPVLLEDFTIVHSDVASSELEPDGIICHVIYAHKLSLLGNKLAPVISFGRRCGSASYTIAIGNGNGPMPFDHIEGAWHSCLLDAVVAAGMQAFMQVTTATKAAAEALGVQPDEIYAAPVANEAEAQALKEQLKTSAPNVKAMTLDEALAHAKNRQPAPAEAQQPAEPPTPRGLSEQALNEKIRSTPAAHLHAVPTLRTH